MLSEVSCLGVSLRHKPLCLSRSLSLSLLAVSLSLSLSLRIWHDVTPRDRQPTLAHPPGYKQRRRPSHSCHLPGQPSARLEPATVRRENFDPKQLRSVAATRRPSQSAASVGTRF